MNQEKAAWRARNRDYLLACIEVMRQRLLPAGEQPLAEQDGPDQSRTEADARRAAAQQTVARIDAQTHNGEGAPALDVLCERGALTPLEREVLLLCAAAELHAGVATLFARETGRSLPSCCLILALLPALEWSVLASGGTLRRLGLVEVVAGETFAQSWLRIDEHVLHHLLGDTHLDDALQPVLQRALPERDLVPSHAELAKRIAAHVLDQAEAGGLIELCGESAETLRAVAARASALLDQPLYMLAAADVPAAAQEREGLRRLWQREVLLGNSALLLWCADAAGSESLRAALALALRINGVVFLASSDPVRMELRSHLRVDVHAPSRAEQRALWQEALGAAPVQSQAELDQIMMHFTLGAAEIQALGAAHRHRWAVAGPAEARTAAAPRGAGTAPGETLWDACRALARPRLDELAQRIEPAATWADLILPVEQGRVLRDIAMHLRQRHNVYGRWGFAGKGARGLGISALFAGGSGTGKTMAAEVLAQDLRLDLYRVDLSQVVSKYIGETEKNLRRVFDAAEVGGVILLFDEADALFGKRSEVRDSHDRYANVEVSYLLQRLEAYRGLAILTSNLKGSIDAAFLRRIRFIVHFPFPEAAQRSEIWRRAFPLATPTEGLDFAQLARLNAAGGTIHNIALSAAFLAADAGEPVRMKHLLCAARAEYLKLERALPDIEVGGWR